MRVWPIGVALLAIAGLLIYLLFALWPIRVSDLPPGGSPTCGIAPTPTPSPVSTASAKPMTITVPPNPTGVATGEVTNEQKAALIQAQLTDPWLRCGIIFRQPVPLPFETRLLIIVALAAALGSLVHVASSFSAFLGNGTYDPRWLWWYVLRIPVGVALAFVFYFAIRGGVLTTTSLSTSDINPFGIAALSGLVGLFSKQASDKLEEVFRTLFKTEPGGGDDARGGKLYSLAPTIVTVAPDTIDHANPPANNEVKVTGANFIENRVAAYVNDDANPRALTRTDDRNVIVTLLPADYAVPGTPIKLTITNTDKADAASASKAIPVT